MHKHPVAQRVLYIILGFFLVLSIVFAGLIPFNSSYLYGWLFSSVISLLGYLFGLWIIKITIKSKRKGFARTITFVRIFILYVLHIIGIIILVWVDKHESGLSFFGSKGMELVYEPINIFTYMGGIAVIPISTLIAQFPSKKGR